MAKERWFEAGKKTGWKKSDSTDKRRRTILKSRNGDELKAGRALLALSNVTRDKATRKLAHLDANYFFMKHRSKKK
jgi:hypothetical protein